MVDTLLLRLWGYRLLFLVLAGIIVFFRLLPLDTGGRAIPGPDLILCLMVAWVIRRPDYLPFPLVVLTGLLMDFLLFRAPGVWTLALLAATEVVRRQSRQEGHIGMLNEMGFAVLAICTAHAVQRVLLVVLTAPRPPLGAVLLELVFSVLAYPLVALATVFILRIQRTDPLDSMGLKVRG